VTLSEFISALTELGTVVGMDIQVLMEDVHYSRNVSTWTPVARVELQEDDDVFTLCLRKETED
jgi:hypothetical protein